MLLSVLPISGGKFRAEDLVNSFNMPIPAIKATDYDFFSPWLVEYVVNKFSYEVLPQYIVSNNLRRELFRKVENRKELEKFLQSGDRCLLEIPNRFGLSVSKLPGVFKGQVSAVHMYEFTESLFPDSTLLYVAGTSITVFYDLVFHPRQATIKFSNLVVTGKIPVLVLDGSFWSTYYPELMNNLIFIGKQIEGFFAGLRDSGGATPPEGSGTPSA